MPLDKIRHYLTGLTRVALSLKSPLGHLWFLCTGLGDRPRLIDIRNGPKLRIESRLELWVVQETCLLREYERHGCLPRNGWKILDIGAGIGDFSLSVLLRYPNTSIVAVEPDRLVAARLRRNLELNGVQTIEVVEAAVGELVPSNVVEKESVLRKAQSNSAEAPKLVSLAELLEPFSGYCDLIKIDCEGAEFPLLLETPKEVFDQVQRIVVEYHEQPPDRTSSHLVQHLKRLGFQTFHRANPAHKRLGLLWAIRPGA